MRRAGTARALAIGLACLAGGGCDLFATRQPEVTTGTESLWQPPTSPQIIVQNLELAFEAGNFGDYARAFTEDFVFEADGSDVAQMELDRPGEMTYENWDRNVESLAAENIRGSVQTLELVLSLFDEVIESSGRLLKYTYVLTLTVPGESTVYRGEAWLQVRQEASGEWFIFDWKDVASAADADSWGLLKGRNRPQGGGSRQHLQFLAGKRLNRSAPAADIRDGH